MATCSSILAWKIPWTAEPAGYSPWVAKRVHKEIYVIDLKEIKCLYKYSEIQAKRGDKGIPPWRNFCSLKARSFYLPPR